MKKLPSSLREKKRYIAFEIDSELVVAKDDVIKAVDASCRNFMGDYGYGRAGVMVVSDVVNSKNGVVKVDSKYVDLVKVGLMLTKEINGNRVTFMNIRTSGALNKVKQKGGGKYYGTGSC